MTAEHAHGIDTGGEVEALAHRLHGWLEGVSYCQWRPQSLCPHVVRADNLAKIILAVHVRPTRASAADAVLAEARRLCCGNNPSAHHAASAKHSELMAFAGDLARAVRAGHAG